MNGEEQAPTKGMLSRAAPTSPKDSQTVRVSILLDDQRQLLDTLRSRLGDVIVHGNPVREKPDTPSLSDTTHISGLASKLVDNNDSIRTIIDDLAI